MSGMCLSIVHIELPYNLSVSTTCGLILPPSQSADSRPTPPTPPTPSYSRTVCPRTPPWADFRVYPLGSPYPPTPLSPSIPLPPLGISDRSVGARFIAEP